MKDDFLDICLRLCRSKASFYEGARKILTNVHFTFEDLGDDLEISDFGFTSNKLKALNRLYRVEDSVEAAVELWERRLKKKKYGSVGFHCYGHKTKNDPNNKSRIASVMGPCVQAITLTYNDKRTTVDCFYRTTELFKKFGADLVFIRDNLLEDFDFEAAPIDQVNFHFANVTLHSMYFVTLVPLLKYPIHELERIKVHDPYFYTNVIRWTSKYVCPEHITGIKKYAQGMRVHKDANERIDEDVLEELGEYVRQNLTRGRVAEDEEEDEDE